MINKNEILSLAKGLSLSPETIEKDYVLGWLLWGINNDKELAENWLFKGGTSLKKCFFETFRFSEDLDFTVIEPEQMQVAFLTEKFSTIAGKIYDKTGIELLTEQFKFEMLPRENNKIFIQGRIPYSNSLRKRASVTNIKLDLTTDEIVILNSEKRSVYHPYTDAPEQGIYANCYAFVEVVAEKIRALAQRARPRDLYDVIHFFRNRDLIGEPNVVNDVLAKKCEYKNIAVPTFSTIENHKKIKELSAQWQHMLAHQLPVLPSLESFWDELPQFFDWLSGNLVPRSYEQYQTEEDIFYPGRFDNFHTLNNVIETIQYAAANRICVTCFYKDKQRILEPLSFRQSKVGKKFILSHERESNQVKLFELDKIQDLKLTNLSYTERKYPIEISEY